MNQSDIDGMLQQSLTDGKLSRAENSVLREILTSDAETSHQRDLLRNRAFDPGSDMHRLAGARIPIRQDMSPNHMHHKFAVFDGRIVISGSYNWTRSAPEHNQENIMVTNDPKFVQSFMKQFEHLWPQMEPLAA